MKKGTVNDAQQKQTMDLNSILQKVKGQEAELRVQNEELHQLNDSLEEIMALQRNTLVKVSELSAQLLEVEKQREKLQKELQIKFVHILKSISQKRLLYQQLFLLS